jgi:hypothetical protein
MVQPFALAGVGLSAFPGEGHLYRKEWLPLEMAESEQMGI